MDQNQIGKLVKSACSGIFEKENKQVTQKLGIVADCEWKKDSGAIIIFLKHPHLDRTKRPKILLIDTYRGFQTVVSPKSQV